ncbi:Methyl-accepting chemotaxis protein CtpH [Vibrio aerogenes CECT 7868]|uniref:Methyl-accepting chemotaxis protein CtpH n=1 Tax=Vibrio aerogenes CECT 7868 TaxID=1216006 RepID=A0A1M5X6Y8_9VIBR|nr:methyl-accepting chemotaxis protein [Vibrio aerogenes]SHH95597.1 Methyl-accepting chemotaxis protein CtpH [Vibrio aerogenes CECT 7868]
MDVLKLSQKQKNTVFIIILCCGFVLMGLFIAQKLSSMSAYYEQSGKVAHEEVTLFATHTKLLSLAAGRNEVLAKDISHVSKDLDALVKDVSLDAQFLQTISLHRESEQIRDAIMQFESSMKPWLKIKSELGFSVKEGQLAILSELSHTIEEKIEETGMVTIRSDFRAMIKAQQNYLLAPGEQHMKLFNRAMAMFVNTSKSYATYGIYKQEIEQYKQVFVRIGELSQQLQAIEAKLSKAEKVAQSVIHEVSQKMMSVSQEYKVQAQAEASQTMWSVLVACAALATMTITIFWAQNISFTRVLDQIKNVLENLSKGDLSQRLDISTNSKDEFNQLAAAINRSCINLGVLVKKVKKSSQYLSGDAADLNQSLDRLVDSQLDIVNQTEMLASATEQVSVTAKEVSQSLSFVAEISQDSTNAAQEGSQVIKSAIHSLEEVNQILTSAAAHIKQLEQASDKVDSVMDIINSIAEQTNLLALNAAIEAARAGEQGRGFAVVADEVRSLAVRTVDAVSDISVTIETMKRESTEVIQFIGQSEHSIQSGQEKGNEAMQALSHITDKATETASQTENIFLSMKELATTSQSMANNMAQISDSMKNLEEDNEKLRNTSRLVEQRSSDLSKDCQQFLL